MKKKLAILFSIIYFVTIGIEPPAYAQATAEVMRIGAGAVWQGSGASTARLWPCLLRIGANTSWIALKIGTSRLGLIAAAAMAFAPVVPGVADALKSIVDDTSGWSWNSGSPTVPSGQSTPGYYDFIDNRPWTNYKAVQVLTGSYGTTYTHSYSAYETAGAAMAARDAHYSSLTSYASNNKGTSATTYNTVSLNPITYDSTKAIGIYIAWQRTACTPYVAGCYNYEERHYSYPSGSAQAARWNPAVESPPIPLDWNALNVRLQQLSIEAAKVKKLIEETEKASRTAVAQADSVEGQRVWPPTGTTTNVGLKKALNDEIPQSAKDALATSDAADGDVWQQPATDTEGTYTGGSTATAPAYEAQFNDFPGRFHQFISDMQTTSIFSLPGSMLGNIPTSNQCTMTVYMGERFGGNQTVSFCEWASWLAILRAVLLVTFGIIATRLIILKR